jgi:hypothetical protein
VVEVIRKTYRVDVSRDGKFWLIQVPGVKSGFSQAASLREVEPTVRDLLSLLLEVPEDSFDVDVHVEIPVAVRDLLVQAKALFEQADEARAEAARLTRVAAGALAREGLTMRDTGFALGVSHQRANQLVAESRVSQAPATEVRKSVRSNVRAVAARKAAPTTTVAAAKSSTRGRAKSEA